MPPTILLISTCDTKWSETLFLQSQIHEIQALNPKNNITTLLLDVGRTAHTDPNTPIIRPTPQTNTPLTHLPRADYIKAMSAAACTTIQDLHSSQRIHSVVALGGSCGTNIATAAMRALPVGLPKLMVSTMASGDVGPYVEETDITMMYSVVDIAGENAMLRMILRNAAGAVVGMVGAGLASMGDKDGDGERVRKTRVGVTMFGVTTPSVDRVRGFLEERGYEVYVFHATGAGGKAMERLVREKQLDAIVDMTTSEIVDEVVGGVLTAGPERLRAAAEAGVPQVVSVGACDMVNFGPRETVPEALREKRLLYEHNPTVTLVRTDVEENRRVARFIGQKLRDYVVRPELVRVVLPTGGISLLDTPGQPFHDPEADEALFSTLEKELEGTGIVIERDDRDINDPGFAVRVAELLVQLIGQKGTI